MRSRVAAVADLGARAATSAGTSEQIVARALGQAGATGHHVLAAVRLSGERRRVVAASNTFRMFASGTGEHTYFFFFFFFFL